MHYYYTLLQRLASGPALMTNIHPPPWFRIVTSVAQLIHFTHCVLNYQQLWLSIVAWQLLQKPEQP